MKQPKSKIFFFHIPKCAGVSVWRAISEIAGRRNTLQVTNSKELIAFERMTAERALSYRAVGGHGWLHTYREKLGRMDDFLKLTTIRHPIDRLVSEYNFIKGRSGHDRHAQIKIMPFAQFAACDDVCMPNMITRLLCGQADSAKALGVLDMIFDDYCLTPDIDGLIARMNVAFGRPVAPAAYDNKSRQFMRRQDISTDLMALLSEKHAPDLELYDRLAARQTTRRLDCHGVLSG